MSIKNYKNIDNINLKKDSEGQFIQTKDITIITKNQIQEADFGECKYDVMEVSVYDVNNNLLPQKSDKNIAYIKTGDIKNYLYNITNNTGKKELAIDIQKLLKDLGFTNGILRVNINFVRNRVGSENEMTRAWIQEISPSRTEIRVLPLKVTDSTITNQNEKEFKNLQNLNKDFKYYRKSILDSIHSFENNFLDTIDASLEAKYGKDFLITLKKDFGIKNFSDFKKKIYEDFKTSVEYYVTNKYYKINENNFGKKSQIRFEDCEQYDFKILTDEMQNILRLCIEVNSTFLKRRDFKIAETPKEFQKIELSKQIADNVDFFSTPMNKVNIVYSPENVSALPVPGEPPKTIISETIPPLDIPIKPKVEVEVEVDHYHYNIINKSSLRSLFFKFTDVTGASVQKTLGPGKTSVVCALEDSISVSETTGIQKLSGLVKPEYVINKLKECNTLDISEDAPVIVKTETMPPKDKLPVLGGGGVTREEAAASTNQVITPRGPAISTAQAAGQSESSAAFQTLTLTGVRQSTITGPTID
jgi:hypothetical protein